MFILTEQVIKLIKKPICKILKRRENINFWYHVSRICRMKEEKVLKKAKSSNEIEILRFCISTVYLNVIK